MDTDLLQGCKKGYHFEMQTPQSTFEGTYNATLKN